MYPFFTTTIWVVCHENCCWWWWWWPTSETTSGQIVHLHFNLACTSLLRPSIIRCYDNVIHFLSSSNAFLIHSTLLHHVRTTRCCVDCDRAKTSPPGVNDRARHRVQGHMVLWQHGERAFLWCFMMRELINSDNPKSPEYACVWAKKIKHYVERMSQNNKKANYFQLLDLSKRAKNKV